MKARLAVLIVVLIAAQLACGGSTVQTGGRAAVEVGDDVIHAVSPVLDDLLIKLAQSGDNAAEQKQVADDILVAMNNLRKEANIARSAGKMDEFDDLMVVINRARMKANKPVIADDIAGFFAKVQAEDAIYNSVRTTESKGLLGLGDDDLDALYKDLFCLHLDVILDEGKPVLPSQEEYDDFKLEHAFLYFLKDAELKDLYEKGNDFLDFIESMDGYSSKDYVFDQICG